MKVEATSLPGVIVITPQVHADLRGSFRETWRCDRYAQAGLPERWVQDNVSTSHRGVLRGLHFQHPRPQGKLITVLRGEVLDVAVDVRVGSPSFGKFESCVLSHENARQLWIPEGFAHGFLVLSDEAVVHYKVTRPYEPRGDRTIAWNDPALGIDWPSATPILSPKDAAARPLSEFSPDELPHFISHA